MEVPTFYSGETISVDLALHDDSGVSHVMAVFAHTDPGAFTYGDLTSRYEDQASSGTAGASPRPR